MADLLFIFFTVIMGMMFIPLGIMFLVDGITDAKFESNFQLAYLNSYMPYFSYLMSACFLGGYIGLIRFMYKKDYQHKIQVKPGVEHDR